MHALQVVAFKDTPKFNTVSIPDLASDEVQIKVHACGLNFADLLMIKGQYQDTPPLPFTLGLEMAGQVERVGPDVTHVVEGDRVAAFSGQGGLAQVANVSANRCIKLPKTLTYDQGASLLVAYGTSHVALDYRARLQPSQRLLVLGASGGVGLTAVEIGKAIGAHVTACARGSAKTEICKKHGADVVLDSSDPNFTDMLRAEPKFDVVYDPIGGDAAMTALRCLKPEGQFLTIGFASGTVPQFPANILLVKNISVHGLYWGGLMASAPKVVQDSIQDIFKMADAGKITAQPHHIFPFDQALDGLELLRSRKSTGKIVIQIP